MQFINYIRQLKKNKKRSYALDLDKGGFFSNETSQLAAYHSMARSKGEPFNFNPIDESVYSFIDKVLEDMFGQNKQNEFKNKQRKIDSLLEKRAEVTEKEKKNQLEGQITNLRIELTGAKQLKEKLKFTFRGFDISKRPIPRELLDLSLDISKNDCLFLLKNGYFNALVLSLFNIMPEKFEKLSKQGENRTPTEEAKYNKILELWNLVSYFIRSSRRNADSNIYNEKLRSIKKMGKEGKKMHALLTPLLDDIPSRF